VRNEDISAELESTVLPLTTSFPMEITAIFILSLLDIIQIGNVEH
jgi:hypothetical protein